MEKTTLYLPAELRRSLHAEAVRQGRPQAELVREALADYLSKLQRPRLSWIGMGEDDEVRSGRPMLTLDRRDFRVVAGGGRIRLLLDG